MQRKTILTSLFFLATIFSFCQKILVQCTNQHNPDKSVSINANAQIYADYTLRIIFSNLSGYTSRGLYTSSVGLAIINRGNTEVIRLIPDNTPNPTFQYKYQSFPGHSFTKIPDTTFQYLLPATEGNRLRVSAVSSTISPLSQMMGREYRGTSFNYKLNDTICAARAGIVYDFNDTSKIGEKVEVAVNSGRNRILIEHRDGTIGTYGITAPIKILVKQGDEIFPGQPLAVFNVESPRYTTIFSVSYLDEKKLLKENNPDNIIYYNYIPVYFYASENEKSIQLQIRTDYKVEHPKEIISAEMTKKEKKKFGY